MKIDEMTREELIEFSKSLCVKLVADIPNTSFKAGEYYPFIQSEYDICLFGDNGWDYIALDYDEADKYLEKGQ